MTATRALGWLFLAVLVGLIGWTLWPRSAAATGAAASGSAAAVQGLQLQGVASCAAAACHHGNGPRGEKGSEYTTWLIHDPHARAYDVLREERSRQMLGTFRQLKNPKEARPEADALCLSCHVMPNVKDQPRRSRFSLADGVGCESCHGPAQKWLGPHTTWKNLGLEEKQRTYAEHGMVWLRGLSTRAQVCTACHVGTATADVNHDLIAAGHPRLTFELTVYQAHMPRHWSEKEEKARHADFEARAWVIGQAACAQASLELLAARAQPATRPWPEFAESDCFACHHDLRQPSRRIQRGYGGSAPGLVPWSEWPYALLPSALQLQPGKDVARILTGVDDLRRLMRHPLPDAPLVAKKARDTADLLKQWLDEADKGLYSDAARLGKVRTALQEAAKSSPAGWDTAMQRYLALAALYQAERDLRAAPADAALEAYLRELARSLRFPQGFASPREQW